MKDEIAIGLMVISGLKVHTTAMIAFSPCLLLSVLIRQYANAWNGYGLEAGSFKDLDSSVAGGLCGVSRYESQASM